MNRLPVASQLCSKLQRGGLTQKNDIPQRLCAMRFEEEHSWRTA